MRFIDPVPTLPQNRNKYPHYYYAPRNKIQKPKLKKPFYSTDDKISIIFDVVLVVFLILLIIFIIALAVKNQDKLKKIKEIFTGNKKKKKKSSKTKRNSMGSGKNKNKKKNQVQSQSQSQSQSSLTNPLISNDAD